MNADRDPPYGAGMFEGAVPRFGVAAIAAAVAAAIVYLYSAQVQLAAVTLAGAALAAVVAVRYADPVGDDGDAAGESDPWAQVSPVIDAMAEPVLVLRHGRVLLANPAAQRLLGRHILGEDARTAIRHPAAADYLGLAPESRGEMPIDLLGLGTLDQRWQMRATGLPDGLEVVHLVDQTGNHAAERMRVDFVANASHELRTPLASILGYVETLADDAGAGGAGEDPATRRRFLGIVFAEAQRMERLVEDLMSLSRIEAEKFRLPAERVDLAPLLTEVRDALATTRGDRGADIVLDLGEAPPVAGDAAQLSQLMHNLIGNAMKYGRAGTPVTVELRTGKGDGVSLVVGDQGDGIAPEHLPRLTERFYRVDAGRSRSLGGTGLGLAIVKHIVERHRGRLDISSEVGVGTRVAITLRAAPVA